MSEWYNSQKKPKCNFRKLLHERINANLTNRENLTTEEKRRLDKLNGILDTLRDGENVQNRQLTDFIFTGQMSHFTRKPISTQQYAKIVKKWMRSLGVEDVSQYSTHSIRKSKPTLIYNKTMQELPNL